jgi:linoleate 10R-lipoxygenase
MARLINCGHFASAVFSDYVAAILGLVTDLNSWTLDPFNAIRKSDHSFVERGQGNGNSVEFNLLYRWHATLSQADEKWVEKMFERCFPGRSWDDITIEMFSGVTAKLKEESKVDVRNWAFGGYQRGPDGRFKDGDLAKILMDATESPAGAFKARGTPSVMKIVEIMTMKMSRRWGVCTVSLESIPSDHY